MKTTDNRLAAKDKTTLASLIGSELVSFRCDKLQAVRPCATAIITLNASDKTFALRADIVVGEPFGEPDDVAKLSFREATPETIQPVAIGTPQAEYKVNRLINDILVYEDTLEKYANGNVISRYISTPDIVFKLGGTELIFENQGWLDETIDIYRGPGASREIRPAESLVEDEDPNEFRISREIISLGNRWTVV